MDRTSIPSPSSPRRGRLRKALAGLALLAPAPACPLAIASARAGEVSKAGLVDQGRSDPRLKGMYAPAGFNLSLAADGSLLNAPTALAFDDMGQLYVAESSHPSRTFDVWEQVTLEDGSRVRLQRSRKPSSDQVKRLTDADGDGWFDRAEVVLEGVERPAGLLWIKGSLYIAALGRLERWDDADGDGQFETRTTLVDGLGAIDDRGLGGLALGNDGFLYLTAGDNPTHAFTPAGGSRIELTRTGGLLRCRLDGTELQLVASGFRFPRGGVAFDADARPILVDDDGADGSRLAGVRLIRPVEQADFGWRTLGDPVGTPDHDLGAVDGDRPGRLAGFARLHHAAPASTLIYNGTGLPDVCRGLLIAADPARHLVAGVKFGASAGSAPTAGEATLVAADDDRFRPERLAIGADSAVYILDRGPQESVADAKGVEAGRQPGRILRLTGATPAAPFRRWDQITALTSEQLLMQGLASPDFAVADRALRELVDRGAASRTGLLACAANLTLPTHVRVLGVLGVRQFWNDEVEDGMANLLIDGVAEVRLAAAEALGVEPKRAAPRVVSRLLTALEDKDARVVRAVAYALGRHGETNPQQPGAALVRWLYAHPKADPATRDGVLRGLERLGDVGVDEVALAVRTRRGAEREEAVRLFAALRAPHAADELTGLIKIPDLTPAERATLIRQFADFPSDLNVATAGLVDWLLKHREIDAVVRRAALATCRYVGNPASALVLACLDSDDESVRMAAAGFAARTRPPGAMAKLADALADAERSDAERLVAAASLRGAGPAVFPALDAAFLAAEAGELRRATLRAMADADPVKARPALVSTLAGPDPALRVEAIALLGSTSDGAQAAGRAYLDGTIGRDDLPAVLRALRRHDTKEARAMLGAVQADATHGRTALAASAVRLRAVEAGNPWAGLAVFERASTRCIECHQVGGRGGVTGPSLDVAAHGLTADKLIDAIFGPGREIKPGYEPARLALAEPRGPDAARPVGPLAGVDRGRIATDAARRPAMPEGLDLDLTPQELADLVAFLLDPPAQAAARRGGIVPLDRWVAAGPFAPGADSLRVALDRVDVAKALAGDGGRSLAWLPLGPAATEERENTGRISLGGLVGADLGQAYAATELRAEAAQPAWLYAEAHGAVRVYLNGKKIAALADHSAAGEPGDDSTRDFIRLDLRSGPNLVLIAFDHPLRGEPTARFRVAANKPVEVHAPKAPEGPK